MPDSIVVSVVLTRETTTLALTFTFTFSLCVGVSPGSNRLDEDYGRPESGPIATSGDQAPGKGKRTVGVDQ